MTPSEAEQVRLALSGSWDADHDITAAACLQAADDIDVIVQAILNDTNDNLVNSSLLGLAGRLRAAAKLADAVELAEGSEAAQ